MDNPLREGPAPSEYMKGYAAALAFEPVPSYFTQTFAEGYGFGVTVRNERIGGNQGHFGMLTEGLRPNGF